MSALNDTLVGLSTTLRAQAVSIIRLSGFKAIEIVERLSHKDLMNKDHQVVFSSIYDPYTNEMIDEALILVMRAPRSYTKEDVVEIQCHGGIYTTKQILSHCLSLGARMALAGEFTQRAVMNGRIDLSQAQAINDMVSADSKQSAALAILSLKGSVKTIIEPLVEAMIQLIANIEVNIDYPEYDIEQVTSSKFLNHAQKILLQIETVLKEARSGQRMQEGVKTAIIGQPNVGKSSLLNALLNEDKAIVTDIAGTTRDIVEGTVHLENVTLHLLDTAGIRKSSDQVEQIGIQKTFESIEKADLILFLVDGQVGMNVDEKELFDQLDPSKVIVVHTKKDLSSSSNRLEISALKKDIKALIETIEQRFESDQFVFHKPVLSQERSIALANAAKASISSAISSLENHVEVDLALIDLKEALTHLQNILGAQDFNLSDELFRRFCLGK